MKRSSQAIDAELIAASVRDPDRFEQLVRVHGERILAYLTRRVGPAVADDLAAETFLQAFRARADYRPESDSALPWLYAIATNVLRGHLRSEQRRIAALGRIAGRAVCDRGDHERVDDSLSQDAAACAPDVGRRRRLSARTRTALGQGRHTSAQNGCRGGR